MSDQAELQARIAALQGRIQKHKQPPPSYRGGHHSHRGGARWTPFGRVGWHAAPPTFKNRKLVLATGQQNGTTTDEPANADAMPSPMPAKQGFVTSQAPGRKQLMTQDVFTREQKQMQQYQTPATPATPSTPKPTNPTRPTAPRTLEIDGLHFEVQAAGSKLIRIRGGWPASCEEEAGLKITDTATTNKETPKKVTVANVEFLRTKHGNLIRATKSTDNKRYRGKSGLDRKDLDSPEHHRRRATAPQCENFTRYGTESSHHLPTG